MHIPITIIIPTIPIEFFKTDVAPNTISTLSPKAFPTTGTRLEIDFIPFVVIPSILLVSVPSNDKMVTNIVIIVIKIHEILDLKNFDIFFIWILFDKLEIIDKASPIYVIGKTNSTIPLAIKTIENNNIGCINETDTTLPWSNH